MATHTAIRLRRSAAQLHALAAIERQIRAADPNSRRKYLRDFAQAFRSYEAVLSSTEFETELAAADVILIGDYHALPASQRFAAEVIERLAAREERPIVLGLEMIFARDQHIIDEWLRGEITSDELRERIRYDVEWGYGWAPYSDLLQRARAAGALIYGLDCMPRGNMRRISARDRHAAYKLNEIRQLHPTVQIVVLFGESHLAPNHLPAMIQERLPQQRVLTLLQNVDALFWRASGEKLDSVEAVRVSDGVICAFNATPLEKYESYRLCIQRWTRAPAAEADFGGSIYNLVDALARALSIDQYSPHNGTQPRFLVDRLPEVCTRSAAGTMRRLMRRKGMTEAEIAHAEDLLARAGAAYLPRLNCMFVSRWELAGIAEQVAWFLRCACRGHICKPATDVAPAPEDSFYSEVMRQALVEFGGRVLHPSRRALRETDLFALYAASRETIEQQSKFSYREYMRMLDFVVFHKDYESNLRHYWEVPQLIAEGRQYSGEQFAFVTSKLGRLLGNELYEGYIAGRVKRRFMRSLFFRNLDKPGVARIAYFAAARRSRPARRRVVG
jgi:hypothetical protein